MDPNRLARVAWKRAMATGCVVINLFGMAAFLKWSASCCWIEPELKDVPGASGGAAFVWAFGPLLILVAFVLVDLIWGAIVEIKAQPGQRLKSIGAPLLMLVFWGSAFIFDGLHHGS